MELLNLVQLAIDVSLTRNNYSEEINKLRLTLQVFQHTVKQLDDQNFPFLFLQEAESEIKKTYDWLKDLPTDVNLIDSLKFQIPYNNKVEQIKEKCSNIQHLIALTTALNVAVKKVDMNKAIQKIPISINPTITQVDNLPEQIETNKNLQMILIAEDKIKTVFRKHGVNLQNNFPIMFQDNQNVNTICKISRQDYSLLKNDIEQVNTISQNHASIFCKKISNQKQSENLIPEKNDALDDKQDVFYSLDDQSKFCELEKTEKIEIFIEVIGRLGIFLYRKKENLTDDEPTIQPDTWANRVLNKTISLKNEDKIAILMQKPDYKTPLIAYEIKFNL